MAKPTCYALIGATGIGNYHLDAIRQMERDGSVRLVAAADPALAAREGLMTDLTSSGVAAYLDYREMLREEQNLDVVVICAPIPLHLEMTRASLERGVFVYLEKPPVPLIQQLEALLAADQRQQVGVGFQMITARWVVELKRAIAQGKLGEVREIRTAACWPRLDSYYGRNSAAGKMSLRGEPVFDGPATNALAHLIHNAMFLAGPEDGFDAPVEVVGELYRARAIESYDVACLRGKFLSGITLSAALTHATEDMVPYLTEVRGTEGWARVSQDGTVFESSFPHEIVEAETFEQLVAKTHGQFLAFVRGEQPRPATSLADTRGYVCATNGMLISSGGIHTIDPRHVRRYARDDEGGYDVAGLKQAVEASLETGKLFSELDLPWAVKTAPISVEHLTTVAFPG
jgi:predicted dehydrogenase